MGAAFNAMMEECSKEELVQMVLDGFSRERALKAERGPVADILAERVRQDRLKREGKFAWTCADAINDEFRLAVLAEEFGEVSREVCELMVARCRGVHFDRANLRAELIQVAAVCLAWVEGLDS
jgi:hypothetical protein